MGSIENGIWHYPTNSSTLCFLKEALDGTFAIMGQYLKQFNEPDKQDRPYFYDERATLSMLAGGIWRSNPDNLVLEEYCADRRGSLGTYKGRLDIWFKAKGKSCYGEAKQRWPSLSDFPLAAARRITDCLKTETDTTSRNAMKDLKTGLVKHALGLVFVVPHLLKNKQPEAGMYLERFSDTLDKGLKEFVSREPYAVIRGSFYWRNFLDTSYFYKSPVWGNVTCPGVDLLICAKRRRK